jgi:hypothetical protein
METELVRYIYIGLSLVCVWIIFSAFLVTVLCINASRLSRLDEPFLDPAQIAREREKRT